MKKIIIVLILFFSAHLFSQNNKLSFGSFPTSNQKGYNVSVKESQYEVSIEVKLIDSISSKIVEDRKYRQLSKKLNKYFATNNRSKERSNSIALDFDQLFEKYSSYRIQTVVLDKKKHSEYYLEFNQVLNTPLQILKNEDKSRIVIDGYTVKFKRKTKNESELLSLNTPNAKSHPILFKFMMDTLNIFRSEDKNNFIDEKYTFGL